MEGEVVGLTVGVAGRSTVLLVGDDIVNMSTLSTREQQRSTMLLVNMIVEVTGRYALSRV